jgi:hypothetical protein
MAKYPEHEKLAKVSDKSNACGEFVDWLAFQGIRLARYHEHTPQCYDEDNDCGMYTSRLYIIAESPTKLLADFFEINQKKIDEEKETMLEEVRSQAKSST